MNARHFPTRQTANARHQQTRSIMSSEQHQYLSLFAAISLAIATFPNAIGQSLSSFVPITPCRVLDTRNPEGVLGGPVLAANSTRTFPLAAGSCRIPANATAYSLNVTVVPFGVLHYLTLWPAGQPMPLAATIDSPGQVISNAAIVAAGTNSAINVFAYDYTHVILDLNGYFISPTNSTNQSTALGTGASSAGNQNTAFGANTLAVNNTGAQNVANGSNALSSNSSGNNNVGAGAAALQFNASGSANTAVGSQALLNNLIGNSNTATGFSAIWSNRTGSNNTASGASALFNNSTGSSNTALGENALLVNSDGSSNIAIGAGAGDLINNGSYNIDIGSEGTSSDSNTVRIGSSANQTSTYIAGINGVSISSGSMVLISSNGQLGTIQSSARYKQDIRDMGSNSDALMRLRPVTFHYTRTADSETTPLQYGLIGEEVANVYPDLVVHGQDGRVESVQYHELPALLLNELQKQRRIINEQRQAMDRVRQELDQQKEELDSLKSRLGSLKSSTSLTSRPTSPTSLHTGRTEQNARLPAGVEFASTRTVRFANAAQQVTLAADAFGSSRIGN